MYYFRAKSNVSAQASFKNENWINSCAVLEEGANIPVPEYKEFIPANVLRRLSPILKNALTSATDCLQQTNEIFDAIIVGTGLGCLTDTEKFLVTINQATSETESLSPTAFIQSTHNTVGGQISLFMKNHSYNMTHTQNSLSFEVALIDAMLCVAEGKKNVLVGGVDEELAFLNQLTEVIDRKNYPLSSNATFFCLTSSELSKFSSAIKDVAIFSNFVNKGELIHDFLAKNELTHKEIDLVLYAGINETPSDLASFKNVLNYSQYSGFSYTNSAFAMDYGIEWLAANPMAKNVLILNNLCEINLGLSLVQNHEA